MDVDETALIFVVEFYETFANNKEKLALAYAEGARLVLYNKDKHVRQYSQNFQNVVPSGIREILSCSGEIINSDLFVHVQSTLTLPGSVDILDECFRCQLTDSSILIIYHSIHVNPILSELPPLPPPTPKVVPQPAKQAKPAPPKKPKTPTVEVDSPQNVDYKKSVVVKNLSYKSAPSNFVPILESVGHVLKFVQGNGQLIAEFETKDDQVNAVNKTYEEWNGRKPHVIWMNKDFQFNDRKK
ncbi:hypothetical protein M9Y10_016434 [Tritrichomonas musculus]|uniref:RRM domain-containing protein n=1 Tax=Tritrichomonas musculus TaxID=1915356 RepID=A0ABR2HXY9_9EUKA